MSAPKGIITYRVTCVGRTPMIQNPMTDEMLDELFYGASRRKPPTRDVPLEQVAEKKLCRGPKGEFGIPVTYLVSALVNGGRHVIFDKKVKFSTLQTSLVPSLISIVPDIVDGKGDGFIPFSDQEAPWVVDKRRGVLATNKAAVAIIRPKFPRWSFDVTVEVDEAQVAIEKVHELFRESGRKAGLGDFRPGCRGQFGMFDVPHFVEVKAEIKRAA